MKERQRYRLPKNQIDQNKEGIEHAVRGFERTFETIHQRRMFATVALIAEDALREWSKTLKIPDNKKTITSYVEVTAEVWLKWWDEQPITQEISEEQKETISLYAIAYIQEIFRAQRTEQWVYKGANPLPPLEEGEAPEAGLGERIFTRVVGHKPTGAAHCTREEGFFVLWFENRADYAEFEKEGEGVNSAGGGSFHVEIDIGGRIISSVITGYGDKNAIQSQIMLQHERQHWLNNAVLNLFDRVEQRKHASLGYEVTGVPLDVHIKDEFLAFLREGCPAERIEAELNHVIYDGLFCALDTENEKPSEKYRELVQRASMYVANYDAVYETVSNDPRGELVYMLLDVPLEKIPKFLRAIIDNEEIPNDPDFVFSPVDLPIKKPQSTGSSE